VSFLGIFGFKFSRMIGPKFSGLQAFGDGKVKMVRLGF
jgi:hypothetical protein